MFTIEKILSQEIVQKLGWSLIHFIWQAIAVAVLAAILLRILRRFSANLRYAIACLALGLMVLMPVCTMKYVHVLKSAPTSVETIPATFVMPSEPIREISAAEITTSIEEKTIVPEPEKINYFAYWKQRTQKYLESAMPNIVTLWLLGVFGFSIWHLGGWTQLQRLRKRLVRPVEGFLKDKLTILAKKLGVKQAVELLESAIVQVRLLSAGSGRFILLPASVLTGLSREQLEAILAMSLRILKDLTIW